MNKQEQVQQMTTYMANFVSHIAKVLPDDIIATSSMSWAHRRTHRCPRSSTRP